MLPICNNLKKIRSTKITKVIKRTNVGCFIIYLLVLLIGYYSIPNLEYLDKPEQYELFLIRPAIPGRSDNWVLVGQILFGLNLIIAVLVKGYFLLLYFHQLIKNGKLIWKGKELKKRESHLPKPEIEEEISRKDSKTKLEIIKENYSDEQDDKTLKSKISIKNNVENEKIDFSLPTDALGIS